MPEESVDPDRIRLPEWVESDPSAPHVTRATVSVDAAGDLGPLDPVWTSLGYDEINWTYTSQGTALLEAIGDFSARPYWVRPHNIFTSGSGFGIPHWGSGNVYHETPDGDPVYDFTIADEVYDAIVGAGHHVLVELGFTPHDLVPERAHHELSIPVSPSLYSAYEAGHWAYPPRDYGRWADLVTALVSHTLERYGRDEVDTWLWELWNDPDILYWHGTRAEFHELYAVTEAAIRRALPTARVGGPAVTGGADDFLRDFLRYVADRDLPLDFVSFHTKGGSFSPWRTYAPLGVSYQPEQSPSMAKMLYEIRTMVRTTAEFERFRSVPLVIDECDAAVPAHYGRSDNPNFGFQNTEYYPIFQFKLMKKLLDLAAAESARIEQATTWSFYFEGERYFEGTRALATASGIQKPLLNAYRGFALLGSRRLPASSDAAWDVAELDARLPRNLPEEVDALASRDDDGSVTVIVWRHTDDQYRADDRGCAATVSLSGMRPGRYAVSHFRIDRDHSNAHSVWRSLGSPQRPTPEEIAVIRAREGLEEFEPSRLVDIDDGIEFTMQLTLPSASILTLVRVTGS